MLVVQMIVVIGVIAFLSYDFSKRKPEKRLMQIDSLRKEIILMDSLDDAKDKQLLDSIRSEIRKSQKELQSIKSINQKLNQQNEKLDRLYNSIHADMPNF